MQVIIATLVIIALVALAGWGVLNYLNSDGRNARKVLDDEREALQAERERSIIAQNALREIAAGDAMPLLRASDALVEINNTYTKEIA